VNQPELKVPEAVSQRIEGSRNKDVVIGVRPEHLGGDPHRGDGLRLDGAVVLEETLGHEVHTHVDLSGREIVVRGAQRLPNDDGSRVNLWAPIDSLHFFAEDTGVRLDGAGVGTPE